MKRLLDASGAVISAFHYDHSTGKTIIERSQDCEPVVERNKMLQSDGSNGYGASRDLRHVASVPRVIIEKWVNDSGMTFQQFMGLGKRERSAFLRKKLNDPDYRWFKPIPGNM